MKAYLDFNGFTKMVDIPQSWPSFVLPIRNNAILITNANPKDVDELPKLTFIRRSELHGADETIINYKWDGILPKGKDQIINTFDDVAIMLATARQVIAEHPERADSELAQLESALRAQVSHD